VSPDLSPEGKGIEAAEEEAQSSASALGGGSCSDGLVSAWGDITQRSWASLIPVGQGVIQKPHMPWEGAEYYDLDMVLSCQSAH
jgi:hypothetical protein